MPSVAASAVLPTATVTVLFAGKVVLPSSVAVTVTVVAPASSSTLSWSPAAVESVSTVSVTPEGAVSLSAMVIVSPVRERPARVPSTERVSSPSAIVSSVGVRSKVALPEDDPAAISIVKSATVA